HEIDHGHRSVGFGERGSDRREATRSETGPAGGCRQHQREQAAFCQRADCLRREVTVLVVLSGCWCQRLLSNLFGFRNRGVMVHGASQTSLTMTATMPPQDQSRDAS